MSAAEGSAVQMLFPFVRKPAAYRYALEIRAKVNTPVFSDTGRSPALDISFTSLVGCQVDMVNRRQRFCDENVGPTQIKVGQQRHVQFAANCSIIEISAMRSDEQLRAVEARALAAKLPRYIGTVGLNPLHIHAVRQKKREPRLWGDL